MTRLALQALRWLPLATVGAFLLVLALQALLEALPRVSIVLREPVAPPLDNYLRNKLSAPRAGEGLK